MNPKEENIAPLKDLMTIPPITAAQYAALMRKKIATRRLVEDRRDEDSSGRSAYAIHWK